MDTLTFLIIIVILLIGWEAYAKKSGKKLITHVVRETNTKWPLLGFLMGVLVGHFFW